MKIVLESLERGNNAGLRPLKVLEKSGGRIIVHGILGQSFYGFGTGAPSWTFQIKTGQGLWVVLV